MSDITTLMMGAAGQVGGEYEISRSLRFNSADSAYLARTPGTAGDRKKFTFSCWVKRVGTGTDYLFLARNGTGPSVGSFLFGFHGAGNAIRILSQTAAGATELLADTVAVFRDYSAWYHVMFYVDTSQATDANKFKIYVNGVEQDLTGVTYPSTNTDLSVINTTIPHYIGRNEFLGGTAYESYYLTDINFIDGAALTADSFGEPDPITGVWSPIRFAGPYNVGTGVNGFHLEFADNSDVTATTLGKDTSGNGNNWTPSGSPGFSVTAGAGNDSLVDSPTRYGTDTGAGGEVRGNYCTLNPLNNTTTLSNGNLQSVSTTDNWLPVVATTGVSSGKWYWEIVMTAQTDYIMIGIVPPTYAATTGTYPGISNSGGFGYFNSNGNLYNGVTNSNASYGATYTLNDVIGVALDMDAGTLTFYKNGSSQGTAVTGLSGTYLPAFGNYRVTGVANFGQRPFAHTAPSGFKALCTTNLPDPTVVQGDDYFNTVLYTGTGSSQSITGVGFQPDFTWIKERNAAADHALYDAVRGVQNQLESNTTTGETVESTGLTAFGSDGFTVGSLAQVNTSADTYVAWNWKANGTGSSNTDGTITSTVSANTTAGISIVTYTGTGANATVGHGLGVAPKMVIVRRRDAIQNWAVWHVGCGTDVLFLDATNAKATDSTWFQSTVPSSTVVSIGTALITNTSTGTYVAYCFAEVEGFSKFGSYTGNGSDNGPFVYTGFRPAFVLVKNASVSGNWELHDDKRGPYNPVGPVLLPNLSDAEVTTSRFDFLSNGFKLRGSGGSVNGSGNSIIFVAFAANPFQTSLAR